MSATTNELRKHVGHRLTLAEDLTRLRCHDCDVWALLPVSAGSTSGTSSTPSIPDRERARCAAHPEQTQPCRNCAADRVALVGEPGPLVLRTPREDFPDAYLDAKRLLAAKVSARKAES